MDALSVLLQNVHLFETKYYRLNVTGNWSYSLTRQDTILFYLVMSGGFCIDVGNGPRETRAGDMIMIPSAHQHVSYALNYYSDEAQPLDELLTSCKDHTLDLKGDGDFEASLILIECKYDKAMIRPLLSVLPSILPEVNDEDDGRFEVIDVEIRLLTLEAEHERMGKTAVINHWASIMMIECLRVYIESLPEATENWLKAMKDPFLTKALVAMHEMPSENWTINKLAEVAGMSRSSFAQRFKEVVGIPPLTYLMDYRLRLAARYLRLQQNSISRISGLVGYASDSTFSQAFKRVYGISPKAYRQQYQQQTLS
ncbi:MULTISPECIES: AraC family transcriptional regulator [Psychrobacter]|jgi:AraC-like DNA-binding protein|uniref:AraC family transcriptional regulator n=1 Tax=Psychrobacter faecalis TaxID=180588 RepID=A0ABT9HGQ6_9GAMM|nr:MULTISPECIES: AraC family transcriptional regulator [Psychrobacter]MDP4544957.1 AraC family transcriptional regulator [Psychrobacter faecalis]OAP70188.1 AraC family transcriptional regulator [Psychrobacter sp. SHUES1]PKG84799.1 AraC family transcriptional regulator [Psychrobacter sp. Sarcosine-02u-2]WLW66629.1 AraC family transcriptional regulator [Psychrobacter sp. van23A]HCR87546.1 AraC family transcriptional regulator [Psychrobacter sp.]